jgi:RNA polymerase sigma factor (sigma-70 family)
MPTSVIDRIRRTVLPHDRGDLGDGELLGRFLERRDEAALAALVARHGPMVWGVCRRLLGHHDAEDAFQATFVVLVRKAASIAQRELLGNWLYGVARQAASQARRSAARRTAREVQVAEMPDTEAVRQDQWADVRPILDEELSRLPDRYRAVVVLSDLEGRTRKEVAAQLGCPEGTVASRLVRARSMLAKRLTRRGVALSGGALAAVLSQNASACVPTLMVTSTIKAANLGQIPAKVAALAEGVLKTMLLTKLKSVMAILVVAAMVGLIGFGIARGQPKKEVPRKKDDKPKVEGAVVKQKETVAWGKEVDGLQAGLVADGRTYRPGEKLKLTVKLRNMGKAHIKITHGLLREYPPEVTVTDGGKVSVFMPIPKGYKVRVTELTIKPGETITLYEPEVAVEPEALMRLEGIMRVDIPTICVDPGKYKIAYGGMIQSHPKLATGTAEFAVKDQVAWGKEIDGLQLGLSLVPADAQTFRQGETVKVAVKLRNVGKAAVKIIHGLLRESPPKVTADGVRMSVSMPPSPRFYVRPTELVIKPGETITLSNPEVAVEALNLEPQTGPEPPVGTPTIRVGEGKYKIAYSGMIQSHPKLATGTVEFKVKAEKPVEAVTAWGKEIGGLQAGLTVAENRAYHTGETVTLVVRVRNVGKEPVKFQYVPKFFVENAPTVMDGDGKQVHFRYGVIELTRTHTKVDVNLAPGKEIQLGEVKLPMTLLGTGKFTLQYERVFSNTWGAKITLDPALTKLATGKLDLEIKSEKK